MATPERSYEDLIEALKAWGQYNDPNVKAAVGLLVEREAFRRPDLVQACVHWPGQSGAALVEWQELSRFSGRRQVSDREELIIGAAVMLGQDLDRRWSNWLGLSPEDRTSLVRAFAEALDTDPASIA